MRGRSGGVGRRGAAGGAAGEEAAAEERALQRAVAVHAATAEPGDLARGVQAREAAARPRRRTRDRRSVCSPPSVLRVSTCSLTAISGPACRGRAAGAARPCGSAGRPGSVRAPRTAVSCASLEKGLATSRSRATTSRSISPASSNGSAVSRVHARDQLGHRPGHDEVGAVPQERLAPAGRAPGRARRAPGGCCGR